MNRIIKINDNIYGVRGIWMWKMSFFPTYCYIIRNKKSGEIILIDTCGPGSGLIIKKALDIMGAKLSDIKAVALSHWHRDHTGSLAEIAQMIGYQSTPLKVFIHYKDAEILLAQKMRWLNIHPFFKFKVLHSPGKLAKEGLCEIIPFRENTENHLSYYGIDFIHAPGHTPGNSAFFHRESGILFSGCALSLIGENTAGIVPVFYNRREQINSAMDLAQREFKYLYPAHMFLNHREIDKDKRIFYKEKIPFLSKISGALPLFKYKRD